MSPKTNPAMFVNKESLGNNSILNTQGSLNNKIMKQNPLYDDLRFKIQQQQQSATNYGAQKSFTNGSTSNNFTDNQRRIGLSVNSCVPNQIGVTTDFERVMPPSSRQYDGMAQNEAYPINKNR